jgi:hypothetical protein
VNGYACSNSEGAWNDGKNQFINPIPQGQYIHYIEVFLIGIFNCQIFQPGTPPPHKSLASRPRARRSDRSPTSGVALILIT